MKPQLCFFSETFSGYVRGGGQMSKSTFCDQQFARYHDLHLHCDFDIEGQSNMFPTSLILWVHISKPRLKCSEADYLELQTPEINRQFVLSSMKEILKSFQSDLDLGIKSVFNECIIKI